MSGGLPFVVVRGPALSGKTEIARRLAERLPQKSAIISQDDLWSRWIVRHDDDLAVEAELVYRQLRLLAAAYNRSGYAVVVDAAFAVYHDGAAATHGSDLRDLLGLISTVPNVHPLLVALTAPLEVLLDRAKEDSGERARVEAIYRAFEASPVAAALTLDTATVSPDEGAGRILERLGLAR